MSTYDWNSRNYNDDEYQWKIAEEQERDLARRCGLNANEASNYLPWEMQDMLQGINRDTPEQAATKQRNLERLIERDKDEYPQWATMTQLPDGRWWHIYNADHEHCPLALRGINNHHDPLKACKTAEQVAEESRMMEEERAARRADIARRHA